MPVWETGRVVDDEPQRIFGLQPVHHVRQPLPLVGHFAQAGAPVFVDQRPDDDRGMVAVAGKDALHRPAQPLRRSRREGLDVRNFRPEQQAQPVRDLIVARIGNLDMAAQAVQAHRLGLPGLVFQQLQRRRRTETVRVVVLIQRPPQIQRLAVQPDAAVPRLDLAEAKGLAEFVLIPAGQRQNGAQSVKRGRVGRPGLDVGKRQMMAQPRSFDRQRRRMGQLAKRVGDFQPNAAAEGRRQRKVDVQPPIGPVRVQPQALDMGPGARLQPDRLPDASLRAIPALLAMRDLGKVAAVPMMAVGKVALNLQPVRGADQVGRDHHVEGQIAALVAGDFLPVQPDHGAVADCTETDRNFAPRPAGGNGDVARVGRLAERHGQFGKLRLPMARNARRVPVRLAFVLELPDAIEGKLGPKRGPGKQRKRGVRRHGRSLRVGLSGNGGVVRGPPHCASGRKPSSGKGRPGSLAWASCRVIACPSASKTWRWPSPRASRIVSPTFGSCGLRSSATTGCPPGRVP